MSLSKQERPEDRLSALDFLGGHQKIKASKKSSLQHAIGVKSFFGLNIKQFFTSRIGKPADAKIKGREKYAIIEKSFCESDDEQFPWLALPDDLRETIVHKMPLQSRINLAATSKDERDFVKNMKVTCKLFAIEDLAIRSTNIRRYPGLFDKVYAHFGKKYFVNFLCDWQHDIAICFCEQVRPFKVATKVYWLSPLGIVKKTIVPGVSAYDLAVQTARDFFKLLTDDCKKSSVALSGWPKDVFEIPELRKSHTIGSCYDEVESLHKTLHFFKPYSFDCYMHKTSIKYMWPFSFYYVARHGVPGWFRMKAKDHALSNQMLEKDIQIMILHDTLISVESMNDFMRRWQNGQISEKFCWWAISTVMDVEVEEVIDQLDVIFVEEKYGPKYNFSKRASKKSKPPQMVRMARYDIQSTVNRNAYGTIIVRDNMVMFGNAGCAPKVDERGLLTYASKSSVHEIQF
ncbi:unnamed protein product [Caenorhabditis nigoni]